MQNSVYAILMIGAATMTATAQPQMVPVASGSFWDFATVEWGDGRPVGIAALTDAQGREWLYVADVNNQRLIEYRIE